MFSGLALAIVRPKAGKGGEITVKATADGLAPATITLKATPAK
jgi:beta-galactosidase